jgi:hypothetical protein
MLLLSDSGIYFGEVKNLVGAGTNLKSVNITTILC